MPFLPIPSRSSVRAAGYSNTEKSDAESRQFPARGRAFWHRLMGARPVHLQLCKRARPARPKSRHGPRKPSSGVAAFAFLYRLPSRPARAKLCAWLNDGWRGSGGCIARGFSTSLLGAVKNRPSRYWSPPSMDVQGYTIYFLLIRSSIPMSQIWDVPFMDCCFGMNFKRPTSRTVPVPPGM